MQQKISDFIENFSSGLKYARLARGISQAELAQALGEKQSVISNWEGRQNGPGRKLARVAEFFNVRIDPLTGRWCSVSESFSGSSLRDQPMTGGAPPGDLAFLLAEFPEAYLVSKINRALADNELDLSERVRRARMFLDELGRRAGAKG